MAQASLMDFMGGMFGGGDVYGDLLTDEQKKAMQQQTMLTMAAKLLQAGGPSTTPSNLGQALGGAFLSGQEAYGKAGQNALTQMLTKQKIEEYKRQKDIQAKIQSFLGAPVGAAQQPPAGMQQAPAIDPSKISLGATPQMSTPSMAAPAAALRPPGGASQAQALADRYRQLAMTIGSMDETKANAYLSIADKLSPLAKPQGQPIEVSDPTNPGKNILVQAYSDGSIKPVSGYQPGVQPMGEPITVKDPTDPNNNILVQRYSDGSIKPVSGYSPAGMSEAERLRFGLDLKRFGITEAEFARGNYDLKETSSGLAYVPKVPGMPVIPVTAGGEPVKGPGAKPTEGQSAAVGFATRMDSAEEIMRSLESQNVYPGYASNLSGAVPLVGGQLQRWAQSPQEQQYFQAAQDWISAKLRKESGAAIGVQEMEKDYRTFFPMPGDKPEVVAQKQRAREIVTQGMRTAGGEFYKPQKPKGKMVFKNGQWVWE